jgi:hypothetical protein
VGSPRLELKLPPGRVAELVGSGDGDTHDAAS